MMDYYEIITKESDNWFYRNRDAIENWGGNKDYTISM